MPLFVALLSVLSHPPLMLAVYPIPVGRGNVFLSALDEHWGFKLIVLAAIGCDGMEPIKAPGVKLPACGTFRLLNCVPAPPSLLARTTYLCQALVSDCS